MDVDASLDPVSASLLVEFSEQVIWCTSPENWESVVYRLKAIEARAPGWRDKINIVWLLDSGQRVAPPAPELKDSGQTRFQDLIFQSPSQPKTVRL